jgi:acylglycerol lipase
MAGSMQAAEAAGRISALLSLLALRRILAVLQPLALLLLLPLRWRAAQRHGQDASAVATDAPSSASREKKGKASAVVLRVPAGSPMATARRQALARREAAVRRAREAGREYELIPTARGETLFTQCWWPHGSSSSAAVKPR